MRVPVKAALYKYQYDSKTSHLWALPGDIVSIELLLIREGIKVLLDLKSDGRRRRVRQVVFELVVVHFESC